MELVFCDLRPDDREFDHLVPARAGIDAFEADPAVRTDGRSNSHNAIYPLAWEKFPQVGLVARLTSRFATGWLGRRADHARRIHRRRARRVAGVLPQSALELCDARQSPVEPRLQGCECGDFLLEDCHGGNSCLEGCDACVAPSMVAGTAFSRIIAHTIIIGRSGCRMN
jgi:hypothetical protein